MSAPTATRRRRPANRTRTAQHRPARLRRRFRHDELVAVDIFSGFGGLTTGIKAAGFTTILAANHNEYKITVHEANNPEAEHWIADLVDPDSADYHDARDLPAADLLVAGVSCVNHTLANSQRAYDLGLVLPGMEDPEFEARVTRSERDRATANCVLHYAAKNHPRMILVECTTELTSWGNALPGRKKVGDGSTFRWWLGEHVKLGYRYKVVYLNSQFFGVPQSRDRLYVVFWDKALPAPDLEHRPVSWCGRCDQVVEGVWTWKTGVPPTGSVRYGQQYHYRCCRCGTVVTPESTPSLRALDLSDLGTRIGDKPIRQHRDGSVGPMAAATMARAERCRQRFAEFPAVLVPDPAAVAVTNFQGAGRGVHEPLPTQAGSETMGLLSARVLPNRTNGTSRGLGEPTETLVGNAGSGGLSVLSSGVIPFRRNTVPTTHREPMPTFTSDQIPGVLTAAGTIKNNGSIDEAKYRAHPLSDPLGAVTAGGASQALLFSGWYKENGNTPSKFPRPHPVTDPFGAFVGVNNTSMLNAEWTAALDQLALEDCFFRMMRTHEVGRGCGFDVDFGEYRGEFKVWGSAKDQVDGFGNAVSPPIGTWFGHRIRAVLHRPEVAA